MLEDFEDNNQITSNIHRIKRIKSGRPTTANNNRLNSNKEFINNLKKGNLDIQTFSQNEKEKEKEIEVKKIK
jgi:Leucine-rich repeat (LRR) protein